MMKKTARCWAISMLVLMAWIVVGCQPDHDSHIEFGADGVFNGYGYVDLGLPNGTLWATCNVGANVPEESGVFFAWGEVAPKNVYDWNTYKYCNGDYDKLTKYCFYYYDDCVLDRISMLQSEDDAATMNWGLGWQMPTMEEWQMLYRFTTHTEMVQNGVKGWCFTGSNGKSLFLPVTGYCYFEEVNDVGEKGLYWSKSLVVDESMDAWAFYRYGSNMSYLVVLNRNMGCPVRAICTANVTQ